MNKQKFYSLEDCIPRDKMSIIINNQQVIYDLLLRLDRKVSKEMSDLTALTTEVQNNTSVDASAITLLNGLSVQLAALANDPAAIQALADELTASSAALSAAVTANTPVVEEPPVEAPVEPPVEPPTDSPPVEKPSTEPPPAV